MDKLFRQVSVNDRNPNFIGHSYRSYFYTDKGIVYYDKYDGWEKSLQVDWWLQEVQFPNIDHMKYSDPDPDKYREHSDIYDDGYAAGANDGYIDGFKEAIDKLKGTTDTLGKEVKGANN